MSIDNIQTKLREQTTEYNRELRWGDIDRAADFLPAGAQRAFLDRHERVKDELVIVDYEMTRLDFEPQTGVATSRTRVDWHTDRELIVKSTEVDQTWQLHEGNFVLVDERRSGGDPLTVFADEAEDPHPYLPGLEAFRKKHEIGEENKPKGKSKRKRRRGQPATSDAAVAAKPSTS